MRTGRLACFATLLLGTIGGCLTAQGKQQDSVKLSAVTRESAAAAVASLDTLRTLARDNFRTLGFATSAEAATATLGQPFVVYFVRLDSLRAFTPTTDPGRLLSGGDQVIYPVMLGGAPRSSVSLARKAGRWSPVNYGGAKLSAALVMQRAASAKAAHIPEAAYFTVRVLALDLVFVGTGSGATLTLTPLADDKRGRWKAGVSLPARDVFTQLVEDAKAASGQPG